MIRGWGSGINTSILSTLEYEKSIEELSRRYERNSEGLPVLLISLPGDLLFPRVVLIFFLYMMAQ